MNEAERVRLYNDLCDLEQDFLAITYPPKTREKDIIHRAVAYVRGTTSSWKVSGGTPILRGGKIIDYENCTCERCGFSEGKKSFKYCPNCDARMK